MALRTYVCPACDAVQTDVIAGRQFERAPRKTGRPHVVDLLGNCGFDDATTSLLGTTFDSAWAKLKASASPLTAEPLTDATRELLARCIIALGRRAAANADGLDDKALVFLAYLTRGTLSLSPSPSRAKVVSVPEVARRAS